MNKFTVFVLSAIAGLLFSTSILAQSAASVEWKCVPPDSLNVSAVAGNVAGQPLGGTMIARDYTGVLSNGTTTGPLGKYQRWYLNANWPNDTAMNPARYIQATASPQKTYTFNVTSISFYLNSGGTGNMKASVYCSTDPTFSTSTVLDTGLAVSRDTVAQHVYSVNLTVADGQSIYLRIFPWLPGGSTNSGKYIYLQDVIISGTSMGVTYPASATWLLTNPSSGGTGQSVTTTGQVLSGDEYLNNMGINQYSGPSSSQRLRISNNSWPANQTTQIDTVFAQFAVSPKPGFKLHVNSVSLGIAAASINTMKANIYYSTDSTFATKTLINYSTGDTVNNYLRLDSLTTVTASPGVVVNSGGTFYVRIYPWVNNDPSVRTGKYVCIQNVVIGGAIEGTPNPASSIWPLQTDQNPITTGSVNAAAQAFSPAMKFYGFTQLPTVAGYQTTVGAIQTVVKTWNAEPNPVDSMWFQYAVSPKHGGTFYVDSVSFFLGGWFSSNLRAAVYYSKDSTFATKTLLIPDTALLGSAVAPFGASLNQTVNSGETFYLRFYPHDTKAEGWAKLIAVDSIMIAGTTVGVTADPPTVTTANVTNISTTFATSGGNISTDGGAPVTARGVVWDTASAPTVAGHKTNDGTGSGSFVSTVTNLTAGRTYHLRAYATNSAGTSYGSEVVFTTLDSTQVPTVITTAVTNILVATAISGGQVTAWGGDTVSARGVCWNTTGNPTIADSKTVDGSGLGTYTSTLYPLTANTTYYVRAYATNSIGTGYGVVDTFMTQSPAPPVTKVVAKDGSGDYTTVQAAFDAVPDNYTGTYTIFVKNGVYKEKLMLAQTKVNVVLEGESRDSTILTYDDYAGKNNLGTSGSYSVDIEGTDFTAKNITFQNTVVNDGSVANQQAVALETNGDRQSYYNCKILGYQDTYYSRGAHGTDRIYMKDCYIAGSVDFIFGRDIVVFDSCEIHINRNGGTLTAASTDAASSFGYVFLNCTISADSIGFDDTPITSFALGRPWQGAPRTVFLNCYEPASLSPGGWLTWNVTPALYAEYKCTGPGFLPAQRISIGRQLTDAEAAGYTLNNIFSKNSNSSFAYDWVVNQSALPVELVTFTADVESENVVLKWTTATEINNRGFEVERAQAGSSSYEDIGFVNGSGTSTSTKQYSFVDKIPSGSSAFTYRLKQIDYDGTFKYSNTIDVKVVPLQFNLYQNYPNPFNPSTTIKYSLPEAQNVTIKVYDMLGQEVATLINTFQKPGNYELTFNADKYASGIYFYTIHAGKFNSTKKMMLLK